ncbi:MAG: glycosyl hydrolase family 43, partial [Prevotella sp.]|nr:glycosyl hydrolase family 43 [Prevotella sp.]
APITVDVTEGAGGKVVISEAEYTSEGFCVNGLNPLKRHSAGIACYYTGPKPAMHKWPVKDFFGSYVAPRRIEGIPQGNHYDLSVNHNPVVNNTNGSVVGYKYFNFDYTYGKNNLQLLMNVVPTGIDATIDVWVNSPYVSRGGVKIGSMSLNSSMKQVKTELRTDVPALSEMRGKKTLFFVMKSSTAERSLCEIHDFVFESK